MASLEIDQLEVTYGAVRAVRGVSLTVPRGARVTVLGSNGAGKSSLLRAISGLKRPTSGEVRLGGVNVEGAPAARMCRRGVALVPEGRRVIGPLTVEENLLLAGRGARRSSRRELRGDLERMYDHLPRLAERRSQFGGSLSGGEQQMLAIARALLTRPEFLLMDEPSMGLAPIMVDHVYEMFESAHEVFDGVGVLLVEQSATHALRFAETAHVMAQGTFTYSGPTAELMKSHDALHAAYLGAGSTQSIAVTAGTTDSYNEGRV